MMRTHLTPTSVVSRAMVGCTSARALCTTRVAFNKDTTATGSGSGSGSGSGTGSSSKGAAGGTTSSPVSKPLVRESMSNPEDLNAMPLPYLSTALGVSTAPSASASTWAETRDRLVSREHRMASRQAIVKEATRGYFHDFHAIKSHGGKTWRAPNTLIKPERALWFPKISGTRLSDRTNINTVDLLRNKVSILALLGSKISEEHTKSVYTPTYNTFVNHPRFQLIQINLQSNPLKSYLISLFLSSLRSQIAPHLHPTYLLSNQNIELQKDAIGLHNKHVGYTYLIDPQGKIRWAASAFAEDQEKLALKTCTAVLLDRAKSTP